MRRGSLCRGGVSGRARSTTSPASPEGCYTSSSTSVLLLLPEESKSSRGN